MKVYIRYWMAVIFTAVLSVLLLQLSASVIEKLNQVTLAQNAQTNQLKAWQVQFMSLQGVDEEFAFLYPVRMSDVRSVIDLYRALNLDMDVGVDRLRLINIVAPDPLRRIGLFKACLANTQNQMILSPTSNTVSTLINELAMIEKTPHLSFDSLSVSTVNGKLVASLSQFCILVRAD